MSDLAERLVPDRLLRVAERLRLNIRSPARGAASGEHRGLGHTSSLELSDHRAYAPGDDFRRVDWNAFARLDTLNVKLSDPQQNVLLHLLVDCSASMEFGSPTKVRMAQQIAACLAYIALTQLDGVRVYDVHGGQLSASPRYWGRGQAADVLRHMEQVKSGPRMQTDLAAGLAAFLAGHPERGLVVLLTDFLTPTDGTSRMKHLMAMGFELAMVHILSEAELEPSLSGNVDLVDSETGQRRRIGATPETLAAYRQAVESWQARVANDCRALGVRYVSVRSYQPIESVLLTDLRRHGLIQ